jgi:hypothetical protein
VRSHWTARGIKLRAGSGLEKPMAAPEGTERRGLSRRDMIKASAAAGVAAWTAPVIIDSLVSPAAAFSGTLPPGCHVAAFNASNCHDDEQGTPCNNAPPCCVPAPPCSPQKPEPLATCFTVTPNPTDCTGDTIGGVTFTYNGTCGNCSITYASAKNPGDACDERTDLDNSWVNFPQVAANNSYNQFVLFLTCV